MKYYTHGQALSGSGQNCPKYWAALLNKMVIMQGSTVVVLINIYIYIYIYIYILQFEKKVKDFYLKRLKQ